MTQQPTARLILGDCVEQMAALDPAGIDAIVTDPPYGLEFMGKEWDRLWDSREHGGSETAHRRPDGYVRAHGMGRPGPTYVAGPAAQAWHQAWAEAALRVLKPGGHLLAFGGTRTYHRLACAVEDAGFEIRDSLMWVYGSGFPKSHNISKAIDKAAGAERTVVGERTQIGYPDGDGIAYLSNAKGHFHQTIPRAHAITAPATEAAKQWEGWGTALKPGHEPIVVARKPCSEGTVAANVQRHHTGALNIDVCRIGVTKQVPASPKRARASQHTVSLPGGSLSDSGFDPNTGRWPANFVLSHSPWCDAAAGCTPCCPVRLLDTQSGERPAHGSRTGRKGGNSGALGPFAGSSADAIGQWPADAGGGASRFFYCAKASRSERNAGLAGLPLRRARQYGHGQGPLPKQTAAQNRPEHNDHPTVKPVALMQWLVRLVTPPQGTVLDPFMGSGTTGIACIKEGFNFIGIERDAGYMEIARRRIRHAANATPLFPATVV